MANECEYCGKTFTKLSQLYMHKNTHTPSLLLHQHPHPAAASGLIAHNEGRHGKSLWTKVNQGDKVHVRGVWDGQEEARAVGDKIARLQTKKHPLNEMAILVPILVVFLCVVGSPLDARVRPIFNSPKSRYHSIAMLHRRSEAHTHPSTGHASLRSAKLPRGEPYRKSMNRG